MSGIFKKPAIPLSIEQLISFDESELAEIAKEEQQLQNPLSNSKTNKFFSCNMPKAKPAMGFK